MTDLQVGGTRGDAAATLLGSCRGLSQSVSCISGQQLAELNSAELMDLREVVTAGTRAGDDAFVDWCTRTGGQIVAELYLRAYTQAAIDAKAAPIAAKNGGSPAESGDRSNYELVLAIASNRDDVSSEYPTSPRRIP